eukprot:gnl/TRDRNA2_/TRDRNA2_68297_c0_seq1.p1 gnl/TRDRNA2_/TRDRNA2_68297_c0~~gnl/TRDRNA2_/TRDRNA2_68297_c0_seq1.p1  ORF type:complete len:606 (-),score=94.20 gnl/TRDRNA2_/TRDRNA2_68297_c0_seq1:102-1673(-)
MTPELVATDHVPATHSVSNASSTSSTALQLDTASTHNKVLESAPKLHWMHLGNFIPGATEEEIENTVSSNLVPHAVGNTKVDNKTSDSGASGKQGQESGNVSSLHALRELQKSLRGWQEHGEEAAVGVNTNASSNGANASAQLSQDDASRSAPEVNHTPRAPQGLRLARQQKDPDDQTEEDVESGGGFVSFYLFAVLVVALSLVSVSLVFTCWSMHFAGQQNRKGATMSFNISNCFSDRKPSPKEDAQEVAGTVAGDVVFETVLSVRQQVEALPTCSWTALHVHLPDAAGYDCAISCPVSSRCLVRLEAVVAGPVAGNSLNSPLTKQPCVLYSATVSKQLHGGMSTPVAFAAETSKFRISPVDGQLQDQCILVEGEDVSLFGMQRGRLIQARTFSQAPENWQDFVMGHGTAVTGVTLRTSSALRASTTALEFQECALLIGETVTLVGELHRSAGGVISLRPFISTKAEALHAALAPQETWRTSWEVSAPASGAMVSTDSIDKVVVSDDPSLLSKPSISSTMDK